MSLDRLIWEKFRVKRRDTLPFTGWTGSRDTLAELMGEAGLNIGAEIGVRDGDYSAVLCKANPNLKLKCVDPWIAFSRTTKEAKASWHFRRAREKLTPYGVEFMKMTGMEALKLVPDVSLDFVYIDANHDFDSVSMDIIYWTKKVRPGGIVSGHDYHKMYQYGVIPAVETYTRAHNITQWYLTTEQYPSYFWVKQ